MNEGVAFCPSCGAPVGTSSAAATQAPLSGFDTLTKDTGAQMYWFRRVIAFVIDAVIVTIVLAIFGIALALPALLMSGVGGVTGLFIGLFSIVSGVLLFLYFVVAESMRGATIGKQVMGLKVVRSDGHYPTIVEAFVRNLSKIYWLLLLLDVIVGLATSKQYNQKFSDRMIGTSVVPR